MSPVSIQFAEQHLADLLASVESGEEVTIERDGQPVARLVRILATPLEPRRLGGLVGKGTIPEDFDTMYADEIREMFEGR